VNLLTLALISEVLIGPPLQLLNSIGAIVSD